MIIKFELFESADYYNLHGDDDYDITKITRDSGHDYQYCDGILYELSGGNEDTVSIDSVSHTDENMFYQDQIERYVEYFEDGGVCQTFPVSEMKIASNLEEMLDWLDEPENFDEAYDLLAKYHEKLFDMSKFDITSEPDMFGFGDNKLTDIRTKEDLHNAYCEDEEDENGDNFYDEELLIGYEAVIEYFDYNKEYSLTDLNHRFAALKEMGKRNVMIDID